MNASGLIDYLKSLNGELLYFRPNPGNAGDCLLAHVAFQLFRKLGLKFQLFDGSYRPGKSIVVYGGGGNLTHYNHARNFIRKHHKAARKFIILPHTISRNEDLLAELGSNVDIICREQVSFSHVQAHATHANVLLMEDLAFAVDVQELVNTDLTKSTPRILTPRLLESSFRNIGRLILAVSLNRFSRNHREQSTGGILHCFRTDSERSNVKLPAGNIDISGKFSFGTHDEDVCKYAAAMLFQYVNRFSEIRTNRLHVAIPGALLGKQVKLYSNSYFKCKAVYEYSIKEKYPNVEWMG